MATLAPSDTRFNPLATILDNDPRGPKTMKQKFYVSVCQENDLFVAQALGVDIASQGTSVDESVENLREALELHFEPPTAASYPKICELEIEVMAS